MATVERENRLMLHDDDDQEAKKESHVSRTNHGVVSAFMAVYAAFQCLQEQRCLYSTNSSVMSLERLEDQLHQLGFRANRGLLSRMQGSLPHSYRWNTRQRLPSVRHQSREFA